MTTATSHQLWRTWRARRDEAAFRLLIAGQAGHAAAFARRLGASAHEAEDAVQDALVRLALETTDDPVTVGVRAWLCRRVALGFRMRVRSNMRRRAREAIAARLSLSRLRRPDPDAPEEVERALAALPTGERQAVVLRHVHDMEYAQVAFVLGITAGAARVRVHRGLARMRDRLGLRAASRVALLVVPVLAAESMLSSAAHAAALGSGSAVVGAGAVGASSSGTAVGTGVLGAVATKKGVVVGVVAAAAGTVALALPTGQAPHAPAPPEVPPRVVAADPIPVPATAARPPPAPAAAAVVPAGLRLLRAHVEGERSAAQELRTRSDWMAFLRGREPVQEVVVPSTTGITELPRLRRGVKRRRLVLGSGTFQLPSSLHAEDLSLVEIRGQGRGRTVLQAGARVLAYVPGALGALLLSDLTFEGDLLTNRGEAVICCEGVEFRGFTTTAGHASVVGNSGVCLAVFERCTFVSGWRRSPGGCALSIRGETLARFDQCTFYDLEAALSVNWLKTTARTHVHLEACDFRHSRLVRLSRPSPRRRSEPTIEMRSGRATLGSTTLAVEARRALFERGEPGVATGVTIEGADRGPTIDEWRAFLDKLERNEGERVVGLEWITWHGSSEEFVFVHRLSAKEEPRVALHRLSAPRGALDFQQHAIRVPGRWVYRAAPRVDLAALLAAHAHELDGQARPGILAVHRYTNLEPSLVIADRQQRHLSEAFVRGR